MKELRLRQLAAGEVGTEPALTRIGAWQFLHEVVLPSHRALPATGSPAGAGVCAAATAANIGISRSASKTSS